MDPARTIGEAWLGGAKYDLSKRMFGASWEVSVEQALCYYGRTLAGCRTPRDVLAAFWRREVWASDPLLGMLDTTKPPDHTLKDGFGDCDDLACLHTQALNTALAVEGWRWLTASYLADPWWLSHHVSIGRDRAGKFWAAQPQPSREQHDKGQVTDPGQLLSGPYPSAEAAVSAIAGSYNARVVWSDYRDGLWRPATF